MVQWVYENAKRCHVISEVIVATDSDEIASVIHQSGGRVEMTPSEIKTGSDRAAFVAKNFPDAEVVINLQGDEPFIKPSMLEQLVTPYLQGETPEMTTLGYPLRIESEYHDPNIVKVITDKNHNAIYFSRSPIPHFRNIENADAPVLHHMGLYAFRRDFLLQYSQLPQTPLEKIEALEQLRALEHGFKIRVCFTSDRTLEINTKEEWQQAQEFVYEDE